MHGRTHSAQHAGFRPGRTPLPLAVLALALVCSGMLMAGPMDDGEQYYMKRNYAAAIESYRKALSFDLDTANRAQCWYMIAQAQLMLGATKQAREAYSQVIARYPGTEWMPLACIGTGDVNFREKKYADAIKYYKNATASKLSGQYGSSVYYRLARAYRAIKDTTKAAYYENLIRENYPDSLEARLMLSGRQKTTAAAVTPAAIAKYAVQVSTSPRADLANALSARLKNKGYAAYVEMVVVQGKTMYRVLVGRYQGREAADAMLAKLKTQEHLQGFVTTVKDN